MNLATDFYFEKNVFVTGANGFLAGWLVKELLTRGANVIAGVVTKNPVSLFENDGYDQLCEVVSCDITAIDSVKRLIKDYKVDVVFHLGAQAICGHALADPLDTLHTNIIGTANILEAIRLENPEIGVIVASSDKAYGQHTMLPYTEEHSLHGEFPYEVSKSCADLITQMYFHTYGIKTSIVRSGNLYGGGDSHFSRVVPRTIWLAQNNQRPTIVNNTTRDYLFVEDAAQAYCQIGERVHTDLAGEAFNVGGAAGPMSVEEIMMQIIKGMRKHGVHPIDSSESHLNQIQHQHLSITKIREYVGWAPKVPFHEGIMRTIEWYVDFFERNKDFIPSQ